MDFSERLKKSRIQKGLTQKNMGDALEMDAKSYQKYELGLREPSLERMVAIAHFLNVSVDYLLGLTDNPNSHKS